MDNSQVLKLIDTVPHWYHRIEVRPGIITPGINDSPTFLRLLNLPDDCRGLRVLDLGARDGFFSFELEKRGADVLALDYLSSEQTGFKVAAELLNSKVKFIQENIYNVNVKKYGKFDIVLFLGLIYHLRDPLAALDLVREVCIDQMYLETQSIEQAFLMPDGQLKTLTEINPVLTQIPIMQFYPGKALNNDDSNFWAPNAICMKQMLEECNFSVLQQQEVGQRLIFKCQVSHDANLAYQRDIATGKAVPTV